MKNVQLVQLSALLRASVHVKGVSYKDFYGILLRAGDS